MSRKVAIIGLAHRLPGSGEGSFWQDLLAGRDLTGEIPADRWNQDTYYHPVREHPGTMVARRSGSIRDVAGFDAPFFNISPREAAHMDPQQRVLLELAWESMEDAGIAPGVLAGSQCGVFVGVSAPEYSYQVADDTAAIDTPTATGSTSSIVSNRISYFFDLHGPSLSIDTACSSALVAFHQAAQAIRSGETTTALAGGVALHLHPITYLLFSRANMLSASGRCHVFDEQADGYVRSEGAGLFLLKDHEAAVADGDRILATVAASAVNSDGRTPGLTVPNADAQAELMRRTYERAGIAADEVDYIEAHGTGTPVGDPIEAQAIGAALGRHRKKPLPIGSVKANLGHMEMAAGVASLVKAIGSIRNRALPPTPGLRSPNPAIDFAGWNLEVPTEQQALPPHGRIIVGINSFGFGGANAHVILEGGNTDPEPATERPHGTAVPARVTARDATALADSAGRIAELLGTSDASLHDVAYNLYHRREHLEHGLALITNDQAQCASALAHFAETGTVADAMITDQRVANPGAPVFVFTGNGCQWSGMGRELLQRSEVFAAAIDEVDRLFTRHAHFSLRAALEQPASPERLAATEVAQPVLFALQVGLTRMLAADGIEPGGVVGHSVGEVAAAWASGALDLAAAVHVIFHRSAGQGHTRGQGQMTAAAAGPETVQALIDQTGSTAQLAAINSTRGVTLSGTPEALAAVEQRLEAGAIRHQRLDLDYAFHSPFMDALRPELESALADLRPSAATVPFVSTVTGTAFDTSGLDSHYWWRNIREPVQFGPAITTLVEGGHNIFIEIGAHPILGRYVRDALNEARTDGRSITTLIRGEAPDQCMRRSVAHYLLTAGPLDTSRWFPVAAPHVELPHYPWQRQSYWLEASGDCASALRTHDIHPLLGHALPRRFPGWERHLDTAATPWLDDHRVGGAAVFPGAGFVELALAAAAAAHGGAVLDIEDLEIDEALVLDSGHGKNLQTRRLDGGRLEFLAREPASDAEWQRHASARLPAATAGRLLERRLADLPNRAPDFARERHLARARGLGLEYGPAFQTIGHGWHSAGEVLGVIDAEVRPDFLLDPAVLDGAFQLFIPLLEHAAPELEGFAFIPVRIERVQYRSEAPAPAFARLVLRSRGPYSLAADFELYDAHGHAVAVAAGARFQAIRLQRERGQVLTYIDQRLAPMPRRSGTDMLDTQACTEALADLAHTWVAAVEANYASELEPLLDTLAAGFAHEALQRLAGGDRLSPAPPEPAAPGGGRPALLASLGRLLEDMGRLETDAEGWTLVEPDEPVAAATIWRLLVRDYPGAFALTHRLGRVGRHLDALLEDTPDPDRPDRDRELLPGLNHDLAGRDSWQRAGDALDAVLRAATGAMRHGERLSVLEANPAGPELLQQLAHRFDFDTGELRFVPGSVEAEREAEALVERYPLIAVDAATSPRDDGRSPPDRTVQLALVVADTTSLDATRRMLATVRDHLAPGARILLLGIEPSPWLDLLLEERTPTTCNGARELLKQAGMEEIAAHPSTGEAAGGYVLSARAATHTTASTAPRAATWLVVHDQPTAELAARLAQRIEAGERQHAIRRAVDDSGMVAADTILAECGTPDHVIDLQGLARGEHATSPVDRCDRMRDWHAALEARLAATDTAESGTPTLWGLTTGATALFTDAEGSGDIEDTALWGFARSLHNETVHVAVRLIDLPPLDRDGDWPEATLRGLAHELLAPDAETEVVLDGRGARFAPRLHECPAPVTETAGADEPNSTASLVSSLPGRLASLEWRRRPLPAPATGEVTVRVEATGLNFRDVMYALGLLPDEALEDGFAGATLGLEFAGRIERVGPEVSGFSVGDRVLGFGPASFSERVTTRTDTIAALPDEVDTQAAATIPTAFFTAYYGLVHLARLAPGERVLIHGAAGGVGIAAIQIAQWLGAEVYATVGSAPKRDFVRLLGVERIHDSRGLTFAEEILDETPDGRGVDVILNSLAGEAIEQNLRVLNPFGRFLELGKRDFYDNTAMGLRPFRSNLSYFGVDADQLLKEKPALAGSLFREVMALFADGTLAPLPYTTFSGVDVVEAYRYMQQSRQIGKIVVAQDRALPAGAVRDGDTAPPRSALAGDATYLVTGGLRGFGLRTAQWLAERGACHLVLVGRNGAATIEAQQGVEALEARGVEVHAAACDVGDRAALGRLLAECGQHMPPLRGIVHAAAVIDDALARNLDRNRLAEVMAPKIEGARHLDALTRHLELDFFLLYSSATTLFGNPGQANYVAANTWLEGLAAERRRCGLPATCIRWGAIEDAGFLARNPETREALQQRLGGAALRVDEALPVLDRVLGGHGTTVGVLHLDWALLGRSLPAATAPRFHALARAHAGETAEDADHEDWSALLAGGSPEELRTALRGLLRAEMAAILLMEPDEVDFQRSFEQLGLDSLMGVELMSALQTRMGISLPQMVLAEAATAHELVELLVKRLATTGEAGADEQAMETMLARHGMEADSEAETGTERVRERGEA